MSSSACSSAVSSVSPDSEASFPAARHSATSRPGGTALPCLVLAGLLWGGGGLAGTELGRATGLSPISVAALRLLAGGALIVIFRVIPRRRWPDGRAAWTRIVITGLLAAAFQSAYFWAVSLSSVSLATLVTIGGAPVIVQAAESIFLRRPLHRSGLVTTALALTGLGLLVGSPEGGYGPLAVLASAGLALLASAGFATLTLVSSSPVPGLEEETVTGLGFALGGLVLLPLATATDGLTFRPTLMAVGWLAVLGTGPTALAYTLYFRGLRAAPASTGALLSLLEPLTATILGILFLGNRLSAAGIAGAALLAIAVAGGAAARPAKG